MKVRREAGDVVERRIDEIGAGRSKLIPAGEAIARARTAAKPPLALHYAMLGTEGAQSER